MIGDELESGMAKCENAGGGAIGGGDICLDDPATGGDVIEGNVGRF